MESATRTGRTKPSRIASVAAAVIRTVGSQLRQLERNDSGASLVELAIIVPVLVAGMAGVIDISNAFSRKLAADQGAHRAIEKIMQTTQTTTVANTIKTEAVCQVNGTNADGTCKSSPITAANVTVTYRIECTNTAGVTVTRIQVDVDNPTDCATNEIQAQYVSVHVTDIYDPMFPLNYFGTSADGKYHITATAGMRTE
jgi:Flp pilus assembly protein TadG